LGERDQNNNQEGKIKDVNKGTVSPQLGILHVLIRKGLRWPAHKCREKKGKEMKDESKARKHKLNWSLSDWEHESQTANHAFEVKGKEGGERKKGSEQLQQGGSIRPSCGLQLGGGVQGVPPLHRQPGKRKY